MLFRSERGRQPNDPPSYQPPASSAAGRGHKQRLQWGLVTLPSSRWRPQLQRPLSTRTAHGLPRATPPPGPVPPLCVGNSSPPRRCSPLRSCGAERRLHHGPLPEVQPLFCGSCPLPASLAAHRRRRGPEDSRATNPLPWPDTPSGLHGGWTPDFGNSGRPLSDPTGTPGEAGAAAVPPALSLLGGPRPLLVAVEGKSCCPVSLCFCKTWARGFFPSIN